MTEVTLKPCPFCQSQNVTKAYNTETRRWDGLCKDCRCSAPIETWNTRPASTEPADALAEHFPTGLRQRRHEIATTREPIDGPITCGCHCGVSFSGSDEQEVRQLWANHVAALTRTDVLTKAREAMDDALAGWRYIRVNHGDLYGVGWDRVEDRLTAALSRLNAQGEKP